MITHTIVMDATAQDPFLEPTRRKAALERAIAETEKRLDELAREIEAAGPMHETGHRNNHETEQFGAWLKAKLAVLRGLLDALERDAKGFEQRVATRAHDLSQAARNSETLKGLTLDVENLRQRIEAARRVDKSHADPPEKPQ